MDVETQLILDELIHGYSYHEMIDGKKVRIDPLKMEEFNYTHR